jgi:hypothetical protein
VIIGALLSILSVIYLYVCTKYDYVGVLVVTEAHLPPLIRKIHWPQREAPV